MGYCSKIRGELKCAVPIKNKDIPPPEKIFEFVRQENTKETDDGLFTCIFSDQIGVRYQDEIKAYRVVHELEKLINSVPMRDWNGEFRIEGEDKGDIRRIFVKDGVVVEWRVKLMWPDGEDNE